MSHAVNTITIDDVLEQIRKQLNLSSESEWELIEEIRAHLEDAVDAARLKGKDETTALLKAAEDFGLEESASELQLIHGEWEVSQALLLCIIPIFFTVVMRWLLFSAEGTISGWEPTFSRPITITICLILLFIPLTQLRRWPYATLTWIVFWFISFIFVAFPALRIW